MTLDKKSIEKILSLPDDGLIMIIKALAKESGVDISTLDISKAQLDRLRLALSVAKPEDLSDAENILKGYRSRHK